MMLEAVLIVFMLIHSAIFVFWSYLVLSRRNSNGDHSRTMPKVSILIPAYNEEKRIGEAVKSVLDSNYPNLEVIVVDDGSEDRTAEIAEGLGVRVIRTAHVGKAKALNKALKYASGEVIVVLDADTVVERDGLKKLIAPFSDRKVMLVVGTLMPKKRGILSYFQRIEYAVMSELLLSHTQRRMPLPTVFGAFIAIRRELLEEIGGFPEDIPGEDAYLLVYALEKGYNVKSVDINAETEVPTTLRGLIEQRLRWSKTGILILQHFPNALFRYPTALYIYWPLYGLIGYPALLNQFLKYISWHIQQGTLQLYLSTWFTYLGPIYSLYMLPVWGINILTVAGIAAGLSSLVLLFVSIKRRGDWKDLVTLFFFPVYGTFFLSTILFLTIPYTILTWEKRTFIK